jgi:hypothetical protein
LESPRENPHERLSAPVGGGNIGAEVFDELVTIDDRIRREDARTEKLRVDV